MSYMQKSVNITSQFIANTLTTSVLQDIRDEKVVVLEILHVCTTANNDTINARPCMHRAHCISLFDRYLSKLQMAQKRGIML
eukprot:jgi/Antlo1/1763/2343